jgi:NADH dehydrogenase
MSRPTRIVILGGGFGGVYTALALEKLVGRGPGVELHLVGRENYLVFQPMLPEVSAARVPASPKGPGPCLLGRDWRTS